MDFPHPDSPTSPKTSPRRDREVDAVQHAQPGIVLPVCDLEIGDADDRIGHAAPSVTVRPRMRASPSVKRLRPTTSEASARPGPMTVIGETISKRAVLADHQAPFRGGRAQSEAEEAERADQHRRVAGAERELDQKHAGGVGQELAPHDRERALAPQARDRHEIAGGDLDRRDAGHARDARRVDERHHQHNEHRIAGELGADRGDGEQRQHQEGDADQRLEEPLDDIVDPAADIAGKQAERRRRRRGRAPCPTAKAG